MDNMNNMEDNNTTSVNSIIMLYCGVWILASSIFLYSYRRIKSMTPMEINVNDKNKNDQMTEEEKNYIANEAKEFSTLKPTPNPFIDCFVKKIIDYAVMETVYEDEPKNETEQLHESYTESNNRKECNDCVNPGDEEYVILG